MHMNKPSYSEHIDTIIALTSFLSMTSKKSLTLARLSNALSLDINEVSYVLKNFKSLFRKSKNLTADTKEHYYTLHLRYGLRDQSCRDDEDEDIAREPLNQENLSSLLAFISKQAENENEEKRQLKNNRFSLFLAWITASVSILVAISSIGLNYFIQKDSLRFQKEIKEYEMSFSPKQVAYSTFLNELLDAYQSAYFKKDKELEVSFKNIENAFYSMELFLSKNDRELFEREIKQFEGLCLNLSNLDHGDKEKLNGFSNSFDWYKNSFREKLLKGLFENL